jgi:hypothetical protein
VGNFEKIVIMILVVAVIATVIKYGLMEDQRLRGRSRARHLAEQQIASDRLNPVTFQRRCGTAPYSKRDKLGFVISYPEQNVSVSFFADPNPHAAIRFKSVDYWSMQPLVPITLSEAVSRLDCSPRP